MLTQDNKLLSIKTPLDKDTLLLARFKGHEGLSELFHFDMDLFSEQQSIVFKGIIGENVTLTITLADGSSRFLNGIVSSFIQKHGSSDQKNKLQTSYYSASLVPWLWLLTRTSNSRIFQKLSVKDIAEKIFSEKKLSHYRFELNNTYEKREYTVQYRETDFNFISRLLEEEGIYYFFEHEDGKHTMVLADHSGVNNPCLTQESAKFKVTGREDFGHEDQIETLKMTKQIQATKYTLNDYNFEIPSSDLKITSDTTHDLVPGEREKYDYPGGYAKRSRGNTLAALRMEEEESRITSLSGTSNCRAFVSGGRFKLEKSYREDWNDKEYLLTRIIHKADQSDSYSTGSSPGKEKKIYQNHFDCIPHEIPFRPRRKTPVPMVKGVQTAVVVGPEGEEIYTDEHGRIKVHFHWDRNDKFDENTSCWLRVCQAMAGNGWGAMFLPRIGHEVIVNFIEGNPDQPIVTGQVYNGMNPPPYTLPEDMTRSTFKSNSSPGSGGFNEIRFEDKQDKEQIFIHAQKNQDIRTEKDLCEWVGNESHLIVEKDQIETIYENKHLTILGDRNEVVDGTISREAGGDIQEKAAANHALDAGGEIHLKAGMKVIVEADTQISLKVGSNFVDIGPSGVTIKGTAVMINSGGSAGSGSGSSPEGPKDPREADTAAPGKASKLKTPSPPSPALKPPPPTPQAEAFKNAAKAGKPLCDT